MQSPDGKIAHAEIEIGDSVVMLSDPLPDFVTKSPRELGGTSASIMMYVEDVDATIQQAVDAGATLEREIEDQSLGRPLRSGHRSVRTHVVDRDARRGCPAGGDRKARRGGDGRDERLVRGARASSVGRGQHGPVDLDRKLGQLSCQRRKTTHALWPPKPNELDTPISTCSARASFGM